MRGIGKRIRKMDMDGNFYQMVHNMKGITLKENHMEKGSLYGQMENYM